MPNKIQSCLSSQRLEQIGRNEVSPKELLAVEEHISECENCRAMFDSHYASPQWSEDIRPALSESSFSASTMADDGVDHSSAILKLLGPTDDPDMLGRIGNYEIVGVIGQGGMGAVFKGFDRSLNRYVAIKMLLPHLAASGAARKRFAREGQAVAAVVDDHVMAIHCVDEWQGIPYLVMTYSRGVSLQKRLNDNGPLEVREILRIGMQAAKGLAAAHAQGIVHRDIKPSNILLDQNVERVQLVDFGLARAIDDASLTCSGTLAGTPQYMSPEQARAETVDHRSDLFSLGSVLYAMCVGHAPYRAESSYGVLRLITDKEPRPIREINSDIPEWLCIIIARLMSKSPSDRYASADDVATILEQCIAHVQDPMQHSLPDAAKELEPQKIAVLPTVSRFQRWFPIMSDKRIVSLLALLLLLLAFLVPWPLATFGKMESAFAFACTAALLSFGLALLSRAEYFSKIVLWGFGITAGLCLLGIVLSVPLYFYRASTHAQMAHKEALFAEKVASEKMHAALAQEKALADALAEERKTSSEKWIEQEKGDTKKTEQEDSIQRGDVNQNEEAKTRTMDTKLSESGPYVDSLEGVWEATYPGSTMEPPDEKKLRLVFTKDQQAVFHGTHQLWSSSYTIEPEFSPKRIHYTFRGEPSRGIYEVKEDGLRLSVAKVTEALPTRFGTEHPEFKRLHGEKASQLWDLMASNESEQKIELNTTKQTDAKAISLFFPQHMHGDWQIQNATNLTSKRLEFIGQIVTIDEDSLLLTTSRDSTKYRLSYWKLRDEDQSIELDLISVPTVGTEAKALRCLMKLRDDKLILLQQENNASSRPQNIDEESSSLTRFTMVRELDDPTPKLYTPLEAIEVAKRFANADHGQPIAVKFRVASVHAPFVSGGDDERGHSKSELHLDFRTLPANFAKDQFLVVLTQEAIAQYKELGIRDIEKHFLDKELEVKGRVLSATMTARSMPGDHFHLIVNDLKQIVFVEDESQGQ